MLNRREAFVGISAIFLGSSRAIASPDLATLLETTLPPRDQTPAGAAVLASAAETLLVQLREVPSATLSPLEKLEWRVACKGLQREIAFAQAIRRNATASERYALALACALGKAVDPRAAHAAAKVEIRALQARADVLLQEQGLRRGPVGARLRELWRDPRYLYSDDSTGRDKAVADMNKTLAAVVPRLAPLFDGLPMPRAEVRRMTRADEESHRRGFRELATNGVSTYYPDLSDIRARPDWTLPSVVHHELLPGHILQLSFEAAANPPTLRLRFAHAFGEAWAIYAEQLAAADDPRSELGYLQWRLFRMGRVLADTGMHAMGWDTARARSALEAAQGFPVAYASFDDDVDRIQKSPGSLAAESLGALALAHLKQRTAAHIAEMHRAILIHGPWPIEALPDVLSLCGDGTSPCNMLR